MKKIIAAILACFALSVNAQNVDIGNSNPQATLDVSGDIRLRSTVLILPAGLNNNVDINTVKSGVYTFSGGACGSKYLI